MTAPVRELAIERVLVARLGDERIALPVLNIAEVIDAPTVTPLPSWPISDWSKH